MNLPPIDRGQARRKTLTRRIVRKGCRSPNSNAGPRDRSKLPYHTWHPWAAGSLHCHRCASHKEACQDFEMHMQPYCICNHIATGCMQQSMLSGTSLGTRLEISDFIHKPVTLPCHPALAINTAWHPLSTPSVMAFPAVATASLCLSI